MSAADDATPGASGDAGAPGDADAGDGDDEAQGRRPYDDLVGAHLRTLPPSRLWVGDGLDHANWGGLNATFGPLLAAYPDESIVAVYDDSAFGRGRAGFVVTDAAVHYFNNVFGGGERGRFALADVSERPIKGIGKAILTVTLRDKQTVNLRVDEPDANGAVAAFLQAVGRRNRTLLVTEAMDEVSLSAHRAIVRLETMAKFGNLTRKHRTRLRELVSRLDSEDARRASDEAARKAQLPKKGRGGKGA